MRKRRRSFSNSHALIRLVGSLLGLGIDRMVSTILHGGSFEGATDRQAAPARQARALRRESSQREEEYIEPQKIAGKAAPQVNPPC
jgi:hypothetical protein